jgi:hypothetical protein
MHLHARLALRAVLAPVRRLMGYDPDLDARMSPRQQLKQDGQVIIIFALMLTVLIGVVGIAVDTTFAWRGALQIQRASDAAALAGVVYMPGSFDPIASKNDATDKARQESTKNGYTDGSGTTKVIASKATNPRELDVSVTADVRTFFINLFGIDHITVTRDSKAVYVTPVPMGSPLAYYGVYQLCDVTDNCIPQPGPTGPPAVSVASQGFFGAIEGQGSNRSTGDAFATGYNSYPTVNKQYTSDGYRYEVTGGSVDGTVWLYDPAFCATSTKSSGHSGTGDHWLGTPTPVSTYYQLWDTKNTPLATALWHLDSSLTYADQNQVDMGKLYGNNSTSNFANFSDSGTPSNPADCSAGHPASAGHNQWVSLGTAKAGETYSLRVTTTDPSNPGGNLDQTFENMFSIAVSGAGATVHGSGSMVTYANVDSGTQEFYLAQIDRTAGAGKTVEIDLFDVGDVSKPSWIQIEPDGTPSWQPATFKYTSDVLRSNPSTNCLQAYGASGGSPPSGCLENATSGGTFYQNAWVQIYITLPTWYGDATHPLANSGWWKIKYIVAGASDTTTWQVSILGNPVHLI